MRYYLTKMVLNFLRVVIDVVERYIDDKRIEEDYEEPSSSRDNSGD